MFASEFDLELYAQEATFRFLVGKRQLDKLVEIKALSEPFSRYCVRIQANYILEAAFASLSFCEFQGKCNLPFIYTIEYIAVMD